MLVEVGGLTADEVDEGNLATVGLPRTGCGSVPEVLSCSSRILRVRFKPLRRVSEGGICPAEMGRGVEEALEPDANR